MAMEMGPMEIYQKQIAKKFGGTSEIEMAKELVQQPVPDEEEMTEIMEKDPGGSW